MTVTLQLGAVAVTRLMEWTGPVGSVRDFFPDVDADTWADHRHWLAPDFWRPADQAHPVSLQSWLLHSEGKNILVDTGAGNGKTRPGNPAFDHLATAYLDQLAAAGLTPDDIDLVVNTHLHVDHVGWNTVALDGEWVPTFRNATYLFPERDLAYYAGPGVPPDRRRHIDDSVTPVQRAGQAVAYADSHRIDRYLTLDGAPGHTPGSSVVRLRSGTDQAVFVGDVLHNPVQVVDPDSNSCFCLDPTAARATRRRLLGWAADHNALVVPAHFGGSGAAHVTRQGDAFAIRGWAPFAAPSPL